MEKFIKTQYLNHVKKVVEIEQIDSFHIVIENTRYSDIDMTDYIRLRLNKEETENLIQYLQEASTKLK